MSAPEHICLTCQHVKTSGSAADRAYCTLKLDLVTNQPVNCEIQRFATADATTCGTTGTFWIAQI